MVPNMDYQDDQGNTQLHYAIIQKNINLANLILNFDVNLELQNQNKMTPLLIACINNQYMFVNLLYTAGANVNTTDNLGNTPLHYAMKNRNKLMVEYLLQRPMVIADAVNLENNTPFDFSEEDEDLQLIFLQHKQQTPETRQLNILLSTYQSDNQVEFYYVNAMKHQLKQKIGEEEKDSININKNETNYDNESLDTRQSYQQITINFKVKGVLGEGSFGTVYLVQNNLQKIDYALKVIQKSIIKDSQVLRYVMTQRDIMIKVNHPFIVQLEMTFQSFDQFFILMEYGEKGDLTRHLQKEQRFSENQARFYLAEVILAIEHLHELNIIYRDLKPENILIDRDGHIQLTDFGLAKQGILDYDKGTKSFCGSYAYIPPQMLNQRDYGQSIDIYLMGAFLYEMLTGQPPFFSKDKKTLFENIKQANIKFPTYLTKNAQSLLNKMLSRDPRFRPTILEIKSHNFFSSINWDHVINKKIEPPTCLIKMASLNPQLKDVFGQTDDTINEDIANLKGWSFIHKQEDSQK